MSSECHRTTWGGEPWLNELIWREFYAAILCHFPEMRRTAFRPKLRQIPWRDDQAEFAAWREFYSAMHQMNTTSWMHNRARMVAASFLVKDLLVDWQQEAGCRVGVDYPLPIVDHQQARAWVLAAYRQNSN